MADGLSGAADPHNAAALLARALGHPLRVRIIGALSSETGSATMLARRFGDVSKEDVFYHLRVLEKCKVVSLERSRKVRGATESIYRLAPSRSWGRVWSDLTLDRIGLRQVGDLVRALLSDIDRIEAESRARLDTTEGEPALDGVLAAAVFGAATVDDVRRAHGRESN